MLITRNIIHIAAQTPRQLTEAVRNDGLVNVTHPNDMNLVHA
jgi:hypothetical protein